MEREQDGEHDIFPGIQCRGSFEANGKRIKIKFGLADDVRSKRVILLRPD